MAEARLLAVGIDFPEGPVFDGEGRLHVVAMGSRDVLRVDGTGAVEMLVHTGGAPNGLAFGPDGLLYVCDAGLRAILTVDASGRARVLTDGWEGGAFAGPNDLCFDPQGDFYFTDPVGSSVESPVGRVFHCTCAGEVRGVAGSLAFPNGLALSSDGRALFVVETLTRQVWAYEVLPDGRLGHRFLFCEMRDGGVGGDGLALDVDGNVYVAHFGLGTIDVFDPDGRALAELPAGGANPTNVAFGGADGQDLFVTEAETGTITVQRALRPGLKLF